MPNWSDDEGRCHFEVNGIPCYQSATKCPIHRPEPVRTRKAPVQEPLFRSAARKPTVAVHVRQGCDRYCGRAFREWAYPSEQNPVPGRFGNPFRDDGVRRPALVLWMVEAPDIPDQVRDHFILLVDTPWAEELAKADPIRAFEMYLEERVKVDPEWRADLLALQGLRLGCWCKPRRCHVDVIVKWVEANA